MVRSTVVGICCAQIPIKSIDGIVVSAIVGILHVLIDLTMLLFNVTTLFRVEKSIASSLNQPQRRI
ncbi:hypothetical protein B0T17DRAFT_516344 [Bombardia bombarda]|uniref:Uncharacterized protein n=1 Tax=Bombardia bombarda TaxID=252184 RepID=A0AA40CEM7_9PEZI|nr:hypothetical protein B0T17DRAFT_516344 [Bombardia bombarda]